MENTRWFLSTVAQSSAAIIAIIGGFIVTKLIQLSSSQNGLKNRLNEVANLIALKEKEITGLKKTIFELDTESFIEEYIDRIIESEGKLTLKEIIQDDKTRLTEEELKPRFNEINTAVQDAFSLFDLAFAEEMGVVDFKDTLKKNELSLSKEIENVYSKIYKYIENRYNKHFGGISALIPHITAPHIFQIETQRYDNLNADLNKILQENLILKSEKENLITQLKSIGKPRGLILGLWVFGIFTFFGVWLPILVLYLGFSDYNFFIMISFIVCLVAILLYFISYIMILQIDSDKFDKKY